MRPTLQNRLMATFLLVVVVLAGVALMIVAHARYTARAYRQSVSGLVEVTELVRAVDQGAVRLGELATGPSPEQAAAGMDPVKQQIRALRARLPANLADPTLARLVQDLDAMADSFLVEADAAIYAFRDGNMAFYFEHDRQAAVIAGYVRDTGDRLMSAQLNTYSRTLPAVIAQDASLQNTNLAIFGGVAVLALLFAWAFVQAVATPLRSLAMAAGRIAGGNLEGPPVPDVALGEELQVLSGAFNHMQENLRRHVAELKGKAELERRLREEELEKLQMQTLLREAELRALQSQVNPHFLFNTLNMVAKTAYIEGADRTQSLLEVVADLLRYSLRKLDSPVRLGEEVEQVRRYMTIQGNRFRDRIRFEERLDPAAEDVLIPCLALQPLVENALIHGLGNREEAGTVWLTVERRGDRIAVEVRDNGEGIPAGRLADLNRGTGEAAPEPGGHTTGLGVRNVRRRLELFYGDAVRFTIASEPGRGTAVQIELPAPAEEVESAADPLG